MRKDTKCCEERRGYLANIPDNDGIGVRLVMYWAIFTEAFCKSNGRYPKATGTEHPSIIFGTHLHPCPSLKFAGRSGYNCQNIFMHLLNYTVLLVLDISSSFLTKIFSVSFDCNQPTALGTNEQTQNQKHDEKQYV